MSNVARAYQATIGGNALMHVKGYEAPETRAARDQARSLIEEVEALGEPLDDPLLLFSALYGLWVANYNTFNGDAVRARAEKCLVTAEKQPDMFTEGFLTRDMQEAKKLLDGLS